MASPERTPRFARAALRLPAEEKISDGPGVTPGSAGAEDGGGRLRPDGMAAADEAPADGRADADAVGREDREAEDAPCLRLDLEEDELPPPPPVPNRASLFDATSLL